MDPTDAKLCHMDTKLCHPNGKNYQYLTKGILEKEGCINY